MHTLTTLNSWLAFGGLFVVAGVVYALMPNIEQWLRDRKYWKETKRNLRDNPADPD